MPQNYLRLAVCRWCGYTFCQLRTDDFLCLDCFVSQWAPAGELDASFCEPRDPAVFLEGFLSWEDDYGEMAAV